jgi:hypothetical protein
MYYPTSCNRISGPEKQLRSQMVAAFQETMDRSLAFSTEMNGLLDLGVWQIQESKGILLELRGILLEF